MPRPMRSVTGAVISALLMAAALAAAAQQGKWAADSNPTAKYMIDMERQWAEAGCKSEPMTGKFIADDFQGTAPSGKRYDKAGALASDASNPERECHLDDAKVRLFGDNVALVYGSERALRTADDKKESLRCLIWTDTWLKRKGKWEIVAAQDTAVPCK